MALSHQRCPSRARRGGQRAVASAATAPGRREIRSEHAVTIMQVISSPPSSGLQETSASPAVEKPPVPASRDPLLGSKHRVPTAAETDEAVCALSRERRPSVQEVYWLASDRRPATKRSDSVVHQPCGEWPWSASRTRHRGPQASQRYSLCDGTLHCPTHRADPLPPSTGRRWPRRLQTELDARIAAALGLDRSRERAGDPSRPPRPPAAVEPTIAISPHCTPWPSPPPPHALGRAAAQEPAAVVAALAAALAAARPCPRALRRLATTSGMYQYSMHPIPLANGGIGNGIMDGSGTINPAALNSAGVLVGPPQPVAPQPSRGIKRSRSPENSYGDVQHGDPDGAFPSRGSTADTRAAAPGDDGPQTNWTAADDNKPRKRGRPPKAAKVSFADSPRSAQPLPPPAPSQIVGAAPHVQTPQLQNTVLPQTSPTQISPSKTTPTKATVIKALPTVRDHTTDQLNPEGDEYLPRETDEAGERKVSAKGDPLDGRDYRCRTFTVPHRGDKLFMLATECARVLGYRDSYLLFNKNRSLFKIIATQAEKDDLIQNEILPYSYRSRQIAIVTARSMFRQFGSRLIVNGRRVRDDYWESKARKQGFTEEDLAGEKRPGAAKAREAAAAEANHAGAHALAFGHAASYGGKSENNYLSANPLQPFGGLSAAPGAVPMANAEPFDQRTTTDLQARDYSGVQRPRQELSGVPYQDVTRPTPSSEIMNQATQTAEFNKQLKQQREHRKDYLDSYWHRPHEPAVQYPREGVVETNNAPPASQAAQSPHMPSANTAAPAGQHAMMAGAPQNHGQVMAPQGYRPQPHPQTGMVPSPRAPAHTPLRTDQMHRRPPSMQVAMGPQGMLPSGMPPSAMSPAGMPPAGAHGQSPGHGYAPPAMWHQGLPQPSPLSQQHNMQHYAPHPPQQSPHPRQSSIHASPQLHHAQSSGSMHGTPVQQYQTMGAMDPGYQAMGQNPYQPSPSPHQQFMHHQSTAAQQPGMPGWAGGPAPQQQGWPSY
ncbi:hypothetical protein P154DRAFT_532704 [Amniculicola lignicola CBS 123094]|uniref:Uncharacterized protein n=1 Tax=Amniculicola lignicola CBS 123094 TaxID=1392246 RepID=A0A6A5WPK5_9PLEO|nr:hypothetical protein P154DRAFT_532704 [Amniculicola lignicola CBS 123094]